MGVNGALCRTSCPPFGPCWGILSSHCIISKSNILLYHRCNLSLWIVCMCVCECVSLMWLWQDLWHIQSLMSSSPADVCVCVCFVFPADLLCIKWGFCSLVATSKNRNMKANVNVHVCACACLVLQCCIAGELTFSNISTPKHKPFANEEIRWSFGWSVQVIQVQFMMLFGLMLMHYTVPRLKIKMSVDLQKMLSNLMMRS